MSYYYRLLGSLWHSDCLPNGVMLMMCFQSPYWTMLLEFSLTSLLPPPIQSSIYRITANIVNMEWVSDRPVLGTVSMRQFFQNCHTVVSLQWQHITIICPYSIFRLKRTTDVMFGGKQVVVCGYGEVSQHQLIFRRAAKAHTGTVRSLHTLIIDINIMAILGF